MVNAVGKLTGSEQASLILLNCGARYQGWCVSWRTGGWSCYSCFSASSRNTSCLYTASISGLEARYSEKALALPAENTDKVTGDYGGHCNYWHETFRMPHCTGCFVPG